MAEFYELLRRKIASDPNLTEAGLSVKAGLNNSTIRQLIKNKRNPRIDTQEKICRALNTTVADFMSQDESPERAELYLLLKDLYDHEILLLLDAARGIRDRRRAED